MPWLAFPTSLGWLRIAAVLFAIPGCYVAFLLGTMFAPTRAPVAVTPAVRPIGGLTADPESLDIGEVWEDPAFVREVMLTNTGDRPAVVTNLSGGCECTQVKPRAFTVPPGGRQAVRVSIDLTHRFPYQFGVERRELVLPLHPTLADRGVATGAWSVTGVVKSRVSLTGRSLEFADLCGRGGTPVTRAMIATAHVPLAGLTASAPPDRASVEVRAVSAKAGEYAIRVTPNTNLPFGPYRFPVTLNATLPDGRKVPCASFDVTGEVVSPVRVVPGPLLLGEHAVGTTTTTSVTVRLPSLGWSVVRAEAEHATTTITPGEVVASDHGYRIVHRIAQAGHQTTQLRFTCRRPDGGSEVITVPMHCFGVRSTVEGQS